MSLVLKQHVITRLNMGYEPEIVAEMYGIPLDSIHEVILSESL
jgi:hypothetical protein